MIDWTEKVGFVLVTCSLILASVAAADARGSTVLDVFILSGQSNACGRAPSTELSATADSAGSPYQSYAANDASILYSHKGVIYPDSEIRYDQPLGDLRIKPDLALGPEVSLARDLAAQTTNQTAFLKFVCGGTSMSTWLPTGVLYSPLIAFLNEQKAELTDRGYSVRWKGFFWVQGEADGGSVASAAIYVERFDTLVGTLRNDLDESGLPAVMAQIKSNLVDLPEYDYAKLNPNTAFINEQMAVRALGDPTIGLTVSNNDLGLRPGDGIHYSADSYIELGHRLADAYATQIITEPATPGDTNGNHIVDGYDYDNLVAQFGDSPGMESADFNGDDRVDLVDFAILRGNFGFGVEAAPAADFGAITPEPATIAILALGGLSLLRKRRRQ